MSMVETSPSIKPTRAVRWRRSHVRGLILGCIICILCTISVACLDIAQGQKTIRLQSQRSGAQVVITKRWIEGEGSDQQYWVAYRYPESPADDTDLTMTVSSMWYGAMTPGARVSTKFVTAAPDANSLSGKAPQLFSHWLRTAGILSVASVLLPLGFYGGEWRRKRGEFHLVQKGKTVVGEVTDVSETMTPRGKLSQWRYDISYRFPLPDGSMHTAARSEKGEERRHWQVGSLVTIFFDPQNPQRHALYADLPGEVLSQ